MSENDYIQFSKNLIKWIREDIKLDDDIEQIIQNAAIFELRHWRIPKKRDKSIEPVEKDETKRTMAYELFSQGMSNKEVQKQLGMSQFSIWNYKRDWRIGISKSMVKSVQWYREQYPGLHDDLYQALADGKVDESIIRRNTW